jgi:hypothetical protein
MAPGERTVRPWTHACGGPDAWLELTFEPRETLDLRALVEEHGLPDFETTAIEEKDGAPAFDAYADRAHAEVLFAGLRGASTENVYVYRLISVERWRVRFEDGYMAGPEDLVLAESRLALALVGHAEAKLTSFTVRSGGQGYDVNEVVVGTDPIELERYLLRERS